jgi:ATP-dependent protease ClpP protease subunit
MSGASRPNRARAGQLVNEMAWSTWSTIPGHLAIFGEIDQNLERSVRRAIAYAQHHAEELSLGIDSVGGSVPVTNRILDDILALGLPVRAQVFGRAASAAASLLLAGATRIGTPSTELYLHRTHTQSIMSGADADDLRRAAEMLERDDRRYRAELSALRLPPDMVRAATSSLGLAFDGRTGFVWGVLTQLEPDHDDHC